jgi:hypothetical protein
MTVAILATAAALFGLQACRDVEAEKIHHVNDLIQRFLSPGSPAHRDKWLAGSLSLGLATAAEFAPLRA